MIPTPLPFIATIADVHHADGIRPRLYAVQLRTFDDPLEQFGGAVQIP